MVEAITHDVRYALRWLWRSPGFAAVAVLSLGLGIGLNSAIFSVADALLFRPLPVSAPEELVNVYSQGSDQLEFSTHSVPDFDDYRAQNTVFQDMAAHSMMVLLPRQRCACSSLRPSKGATRACPSRSSASWILPQ